MSPKSHPAPHGQSVLTALCSHRRRAWPGLLQVFQELGCCLLGAGVLLGSCGLPPSSLSSPEWDGDGFWWGETLGEDPERDAPWLGALVSGRDQRAALAAWGARFLWIKGTKSCVCLTWMVARPLSFHAPLDLSPCGAISPLPGSIQTAPGMGWWSNLAQGWVGGLGFPCRCPPFT